MSNLKEIAQLFLKLGIIGFGGPAAHIAMMQDEVVRKRKWMDEQHFLDLIGATNLIPGPNSTEMAIHIGYDRGGWKGLIVAGLYKNYGQLPELQPFVYGITPAIIAIIAAAVYPLAKKSLKSTQLWLIGFSALVLNFLGVSEIIVLFGAGFLAMGLKAIQTNSSSKLSSILPLPLLQITGAGLAATGSMGLFLTFLKVGAILYGSGYVLFAFLDTELVATGLLSRQQLIDAIAVGQFTPGPVFSSVTFIGYQIDDFKGALVATLGIFIPSFVFVALLNPLVKKVRNSAIFASFLDAVNVASVAVIAVICVEMGLETITDWRTITITLLSFLVVFGFRKLNSAFIVVGGSLAGFLLTLIG